MTGGIGHGLPFWLPDGFLNVEQTIALGDVDLNLDPQLRCPVCKAFGEPRPVPDRLDPAHIVTKGMGGRPNGAGPTVRLCRYHHDLEHFHADGVQRTMAIREADGAICWLERVVDHPDNLAGRRGTITRNHPGHAVIVTVLGHRHPWAWW